MMDFIREGGFMMHPIIAGTLLAGVSAVKAAGALRRGRGGQSAADGVIFWGGFAMLLGVLGTIVGFSQIARVVERAGQVEPTLLWGGVRVALTTVIAGSLVFVLALFTWAPLRWLGARREPSAAGPAAGDKRLAILEQELQALRGELDNLSERTAFYERLRTR
jgi:hypothetical protein